VSQPPWLLDVAWLRRLRYGVDGLGRMRSWSEVAQIAGIEEKYAGRLVRGNILPAQTLVIDPRELEPELKPLMDDAAVAAWQQDPRCLCGCGQITNRENNTRAKVPRGAHRLWVTGHMNRMPWLRELHAENGRRFDTYMRMSETQRRRSIDTLILGGRGGLLDEYLQRTGTQISDFADKVGLGRTLIIRLRTGHHRSVDILTFAKIMNGIGEPMGRHAIRILREVTRNKTA
jgi:hypothetical protein